MVLLERNCIFLLITCWIAIASGLIPAGHDASRYLVRNRRSNIPCGSAFTPCNRRAFAVDASQDQPLDTTTGDTVAATGTGAGDPTATAGQFVTAPNIRKQMLQLATSEAKDEVDRLLNQTDQGM